MSDVAIGKPQEQRLLAPVTVAILLAVGVASFVAMLVLGAYAPDLRGGGNGGGHALSDAVQGFSGIVRLADATGRHPRIVRDAHLYDTDDLVIATPENGIVNVDAVVGPRLQKPTLLVLPKWETQPHRDHRGWAYVAGLKSPDDPAHTLYPAATLPVVQRRSGGRPLTTVEPSMTGVAFAAPRPLQAIKPLPPGWKPGRQDAGYGRLEPLIVDEAGNIVLGRFANRRLFVLADPDLLDNRGVHDRRTAASALAMLDWLNDTGAQGIAFDVTLNGFAHGASPLKLIFQPPFLALTLSLAAAILLALLGTLHRFGSPRPRARAIAFGKAALVDNTAALVRKAGREAWLGGRYVEVVREAAVRAFAVPARLRGDALDAYLDRLGRDRSGGGQRFTALAGAVAEADNKTDLVNSARALHDWVGERK